MNILFIGDIVGRPGRNAVKALLPEIKEKYSIDVTLANGENMAAGLGITIDKYNEMREVGIDYFTGGNHIFVKPEIIPYLDDEKIHILRPANLPNPSPGRGVGYFEYKGKKIQIINLIGKAFMKMESDDYFATIDSILESSEADVRLVDFHAEATSEKAVLGFYLDGKITVFLGTHTHVPTADERILPNGTAFQTDVGMTGPLNSSLGAKLENYLEAHKAQSAAKYEVAKGPVVFNATLITMNDETNKAEKIERIQRIFENQS